MYKLYGGAMGGGKTVAVCAESIALSCDYPNNSGYLARHELQSFKRSTLPCLEDLLSRSNLILQHHRSDHFFKLTNGSEIWYGGLGDDQKAIEKLKSMNLGWFGIDEASETTEAFFLMLASRLRLQLPRIRYFGLLASNPDPGWLKVRFIDTHRPNHIFIPALPTDNPHLPADYVGRLKEIFPSDWQARFLGGDWSAFDGVNNVFPYQAIHAAMERKLPNGTPVCLGIDIARYGDDESVFATRRGPVVPPLVALSKADLMTVTGRAVEQIRAVVPSVINPDADGLGAGVVDRLREQGFRVGEIHGGAPARDRERFKNRKAELYWNFRERLVAGDVALPEDIELQAQLTSITYRVLSSGQIEITPKDEMKRKGLKSPDRAEAVIYAFADEGAPGAVELAARPSVTDNF